MMDLSAAILGVATGTYTVTRNAGASYDANGWLVAGTTSTLTITACVQPLAGREVQRLPEGKRNREARAVFTPTPLSAGPNLPDQIQIDGSTWEVDSVQDWEALGGFCRAVVLKMGG
jgi:hypothetical protein